MEGNCVQIAPRFTKHRRSSRKLPFTREERHGTDNEGQWNGRCVHGKPSLAESAEAKWVDAWNRGACVGAVFGSVVIGLGARYPPVVEIGYVDLDQENIHGLSISHDLI